MTSFPVVFSDKGKHSGTVGTLRKGAWSQEEDECLRRCIEKYGEGNWRQVPIRAGLRRCRKSCRLRWVNYLKPNLKRGEFAEDEIDLIVRLHWLLGNRWSLIAGRIPGRTANDIKNYWNSHLSKKVGLDPPRVQHSNTITKKIGGVNKGSFPIICKNEDEDMNRGKKKKKENRKALPITTIKPKPTRILSTKFLLPYRDNSIEGSTIKEASSTVGTRKQEESCFLPSGEEQWWSNLEIELDDIGSKEEGFNVNSVKMDATGKVEGWQEIGLDVEFLRALMSD